MAGSLEVRQRAVAIAEAAYGPDHPKVAIQLNDLANTFLLQGDYARARALYERARATYERRLGADHIGASTASYNLALLNVKLGDFAEARRGLLSVLATCERTLGPENPNVARASSALAGLLANHGFDREAQPYFERALAIRKRQLGSEHPYVAVTLSAWAASLARSGQLARAHELSRRALGIWEVAGARDMLADGLVDHARIQLRRGELADAERAYRKALDLRTGLLGSSHPSIAEAEGGLATVLIRLDERGEAFERALRADEIGRTHARLTLASLSERQALDYASSRPAGLDIALSILPDTAAGRPLAYDALIRGRALTLDEMASRRGLRGTEQAQDVSPLWDALTSARQRLANLVTRGPASASPQQYGALVESARRDKESAERALAERSAAFRSQLARADVGLAQVAAALPDDTALVSYVRFDRIVRGDDDRSVPEQVPTYAAFVLRAGAAAPAFALLVEASVAESRIQRWRREAARGPRSAASPASSAERRLRGLGAEVRRTLWDPLARQLVGVTRVFVVPDAAISLLPLAALPDEAGEYLLQRGPVIHYLTAERDLAAAPLDTRRGRGLLALGGPAFGDDSVFSSIGPAHDGVPREASAATEPGHRSPGSQCATYQSMTFRPLPGTAGEVEDLGVTWSERAGASDRSRGSNLALTGSRATERVVKELSSGRRVLHLATHGFFLSDRCDAAIDGTRAVGALAGPAGQGRNRPSRDPIRLNPLLFTGLAFAGANRRAVAGPDDEDGILTAEEVASLNLSGTEWAVLSACDTGLGEIRAGEGVFGLRRAFQIAGARTVIMSLWSVDDQATRDWMRALYDGRLARKLSTADAVREASLTVLRERRARGQSTHPFYWAAFVAAGDWR